MSFSVNTNIASLQAQNYLRASSSFQSKTINQVTSGLRIVNSGDDAAGLAIANGFRSDEAVLTQGVRNATDGISTLQTIDGGMNNISTLLDRARTLATQSASGTFSGDRNVLNAEFTSVIGEIDRQAQAIGLNSGGDFAKALSVFVGGGRASNGITAANNGSIGIDLSNSIVDAKSLGLKGVQAAGNSTVDLSSSSATSVQNIIADATNKASEAQSGFTTFTFKGPGFSDSNTISISVNLAGVTDTQTLTTAINSAIQNAGNGATAAATAFKNSNISASIVTDANGAQHLAFGSSSTAFEVSAGDKTANALLGNIQSGVTGKSLQTTYAGYSNLNTATTATQATTIKLQVQGAGMTSPDTLSVSVAKGDSVSTILTNLTSAVAADANLAKAGITISSQANGTPLSFQTSNGQQFSVIAGGDVENLLGLGSARLGSVSSAVQYGTTTGIAYSNTASAGTANFEFEFNGAASSSNAIAVNLSQGDATAGTVTGTNTATTVNTSTNNKLDLAIDGTAYNVTLTSSATASKVTLANDIQTVIGAAGTVTVDNSGHLVIASASKGANSSVQILAAAANDAATALGLNGQTGTGASRTGSDVANYLNQQFAQNATLEGAGLKATFDGVTNKLTVASTNSTEFQLNAFGNTSAGSVISSKASTFDTTGGNNVLTLKVDGGSTQTITLTAGAAQTAAQIKTDIDAVGITGLTVTVSSGHVILTSAAGSAHSIQVTGGTANSVLGFSTSTVSGKDADTGFGVTGASFTGNTQSAAPATSPNAISDGSYQTSAFTFSALANGADSQTINISAIDASGASHTANVVLQNNTTTQNGASIDAALNAINTQLQQSNQAALQSITAVKYDDAGTEKIKFVSAATNFGVTVGNTGSSTGFSGAGTTAAASVTGSGSTADISNQTTAQAAVTALASAVQALGKAQAVIGRGQNLFTYASNLAQSQLTNEAASESQIRDADLAQAAANLTKAQILVQAGTAALAQANSAPQAILSLLQH
jgi:flagellin